MEASALRKGFCQDLNWLYIIAIIFCLPCTSASAPFLTAFVSQPPPGKGVYGTAKCESLESSMREKKHCYVMFFVGKTRLDEAGTEALALKIILGNIS